MTSRRIQKAAEAFRESISRSILFDLKDPRVKGVTVTYVEVAPDMRSAKVHVSVMGDETQQKLTLHGLQSAAGFLQAKLGDRIETRYTPRLTFVLDLGVKHSIEVSRILQEVLPKPELTPSDEVTAAESALESDPDEDSEIGVPADEN